MKSSRIASLMLIASCASLPVMAGWEATKTQTSGSESLQYALFTPTTQAGKKYPLVVHLHGNGQGPNTLIHASPLLTDLADASVQNQTPCFIFAPACPQTGNQPKWVDTDWGQCSYSTTTVPVSISMQLVIDGIRSICATYPSIDTNRIHIAGGSMGGMGTWDAIVRYPGLFASATPVSGGGDNAKASLVAHVPVWAFALSGDALTPTCGPRDMIAAIRAAAGIPLYTEFQSSYYHLWDQPWGIGYGFGTLENISWMLRQVKSTAVPTKVAGVTVTATTPYSINVAWQAATDAVGDPRRIHYVVFRNGAQLNPTQINMYAGNEINSVVDAILRLDSTRFVDTDSTLKENTTYRYTVQAYNDNAYFGPASDEVSVTTSADNTPPAIRDIVDMGDSTKLVVAFTERVDAASAQSAGNYSLGIGVAVSAAKLQAGSSSVLLTVNKMKLHTSYVVMVNGVKDQTGRNTMSNASATYTFDYLKGVRYDFYGSTPSNFDDMVKQTPTKTGTGANFNVSFPSTGGIRYTAALQILVDGVYRIGGAVPNDAFRVVIDGKTMGQVMWADKLAESVVVLTRGLHHITVYNAQASGASRLYVCMKSPGPSSDRIAIPDAVLFYNPDGPTGITGPATRSQPIAGSLAVGLRGNETTVTYHVAQDAKMVTLDICDLQGRVVLTLVNGPRPAGGHHTSLGGSGTPLSSGYYIARLRIDAREVSKVLGYQK